MLSGLGIRADHLYKKGGMAKAPSYGNKIGKKHCRLPTAHCRLPTAHYFPEKVEP